MIFKHNQFILILPLSGCSRIVQLKKLNTSQFLILSKILIVINGMLILMTCLVLLISIPHFPLIGLIIPTLIIWCLNFIHLYHNFQIQPSSTKNHDFLKKISYLLLILYLICGLLMFLGSFFISAIHILIPLPYYTSFYLLWTLILLISAFSILLALLNIRSA